MSQYKFYINYSFQFLFGFDYSKEFSFQIYFACFTFGVGLTESAEGFGFWRE